MLDAGSRRSPRGIIVAGDGSNPGRVDSASNEVLHAPSVRKARRQRTGAVAAELCERGAPVVVTFHIVDRGTAYDDYNVVEKVFCKSTKMGVCFGRDKTERKRGVMRLNGYTDVTWRKHSAGLG